MDENDQQLLEGEMRTEAVREELLAEQVTEERAEDIEEEALLTEQEEANEFDAIRESEAESVQQEAEEIKNRGADFGGPSIAKWGFVFILAIANDAVDLLDLTGIGAILAWIISLGLTVTIILILWFFDGKVKRANRLLAELGQPQVQLSGQMRLQEELSGKWRTGASSLAQKRTALKSKFPELASSPKTIANTAMSVLRGGNPMTKILIGSAIETIPYVDLINLVVVWAFLAYLDERKTYMNARRASEETYNQMLTSAAEMV